jgi:hypothetical protein
MVSYFGLLVCLLDCSLHDVLKLGLGCRCRDYGLAFSGAGETGSG